MSESHKLSKRDADIIKAYTAGVEAAADIQDRFHIGPGTLYRILKVNGIPTRQGPGSRTNGNSTTAVADPPKPTNPATPAFSIDDAGDAEDELVDALPHSVQTALDNEPIAEEPPRRNYPAGMRTDVIRYFQAGNTIEKIAGLFQIAPDNVERILLEAGIDRVKLATADVQAATAVLNADLQTETDKSQTALDYMRRQRDADVPIMYEPPTDLERLNVDTGFKTPSVLSTPPATPLNPSHRRYQVVVERTIRDVVVIEAPDFADASRQALTIDGVQDVFSVTRVDAT